MVQGQDPKSRWLRTTVLRHKALVLVLGASVLAAAIPALAQTSTDPSSNEVANLRPGLGGPSPDADAPEPPQGGPTGTTRLPNSDLNPMPATSGTLGLFTLESGEMLESGWSFLPSMEIASRACQEAWWYRITA